MTRGALLYTLLSMRLTLDEDRFESALEQVPDTTMLDVERLRIALVEPLGSHRERGKGRLQEQVVVLWRAIRYAELLRMAE